MAFIPVVPNWSSGVRDSYEFRTEIITSRNGQEMRRAQRNAPRRSVSISALLSGGLMRRVTDALALSRIGNATAADHTAEPAILIADAGPTQSTLSLASVPAWLMVGAAVALTSQRDTATGVVDAVVGTTVTLTAQHGVTWPVGTRVRPLLDVFVAPQNELTAPVPDIATAALTFEVQPGSWNRTPAELTDEDGFQHPNVRAAEGVFYGRYVLLRKPNLLSAPKITMVNGAERVDYGRGVVRSYVPTKFAQRQFSAQYLGLNREDTLSILDIFLRTKGRAGEVFVPTWGEDFPERVAVADDRTQIAVSGSEIYDAYHDDLAHRSILVADDAGNLHPAQIQSIALASGDTVLTLDAAMPAGFTLATISRISWMFVCRFASDTLTVQWITDGVAQILLNLVTLEDRPVETLYGTNWLLTTGYWRDLGQWEDTATWKDAP